MIDNEPLLQNKLSITQKLQNNFVQIGLLGFYSKHVIEVKKMRLNEVFVNSIICFCVPTKTFMHI